MLWRLVCHDIWFVWERLEFLQIEEQEMLCEVPFKVTHLQAISNREFLLKQCAKDIYQIVDS